jgi:predicted dehydrogenase
VSSIGAAPAAAAAAQGDIPRIGVGMLGYQFMGKAHSNAFKTLAYMTWPPPMLPELVALGGRNEDAVAEAAARYGFERFETDWRALVADPRIELFDNLAPNNLHAEPTIAAAEAGKHVICEKPLGRTADESLEIWRRVAATGVKHLCAFNYRFVPAVRLAREMLEAGELGEIHHFRGAYLQDWIADPQAPVSWRLVGDEAGSGALGDIGTHVIDLARYLVGEIATVSAITKTFVRDRPGGTVSVDDAVESVGRVRVRGGRHDRGVPLRGRAQERAALGDQRLQGLDGLRPRAPQRAAGAAHGLVAGARTQGFRTVLVSEPDHPFWEHWWPQGHIIGWEHSFVHELHHVLTAIRTGGDIAPHGATFEDGYRASEVADAMLRSAAEGTRQTLAFRGLDGG